MYCHRSGKPLWKASAIIAATNKLMTIGLDADLEEGEKTQYMAREMGGQMIFIETDLSRDEDISNAVAEASKLGTIKYLVNNVQIQYEKLQETLPIEQYNLAQYFTLRAPVYLTKLVIPHIRKNEDGRGVIGNMISIPSSISWLSSPMYHIMRMALAALSQSISIEGDGKIRSFSLNIDCVKTTLSENEHPLRIRHESADSKQGLVDTIHEESHIKEAMSPIEVANLLIFGFSCFGTYLKGAVYPFNTGYGTSLSERENQIMHC